MTASMLKSIDYHESAGDIVLAVNTSNYEWETVLMQYTVDLK